jgi:glutamate-1-semialdehyde 2,1-aminomutase
MNYSYSTRLHRAIPGGTHTYSRGDDQFPSNAPQILASGKDAYVFDPDGNKYLDYGMALRSVTLGYANEAVNDAVMKAINQGVNLTRASLIELEAAEALINLIPSVEMVKFAKNGSNVTTAAVKIARAYTGRQYICVPKQHPFFSFDDWFIGTTPVKRGIPKQAYRNTLLFDYGDINSLKKLFKVYKDKIAGVMMEPATNISPCPTDCSETIMKELKLGCIKCPNLAGNFLHQVQELCRSNNALFMLDEMITGFRWHLQGAQTFFGVDPDITTFGKGMANGFAVSAVGGKRKYMEIGSTNKPGVERTFLLSTTHGAEMTGLAAFLKTVEIYKNSDVIDHLWNYGQSLKEGVNEISRSLGIEKYFYIEGPGICLNYVAKNINGVTSLEMKTLFMQEMLKLGILMPWISVSYKHGQKELEKTLESAWVALQIYKKALMGNISDYIIGPVVKPVFRKFN